MKMPLFVAVCAKLPPQGPAFPFARNFLAGFLLIILGGCAAPEPVVRYLLPLPPDKPRVEWLGTYASADDFPKTASQKNMDLLLGKVVERVLSGPSGIAADGEGKIFVGDIYLSNIVVFDLKAKSITNLLTDGGADLEPRQMTFDQKKQLYVCNSAGRKVMVYSRQGGLIRTYHDDLMVKPFGVAVDDARRRLYVSDIGANLIHVFDLDSGKVLFSFGKVGDKEGEIYNPLGLALAKDGSVYVVEGNNARISIFNPDGSFRRLFGDRDDSLRGFENPRGVQLDSEGNLWAIDFRRGALRAYDQEGALLFAMESPVTHVMGFATPAGIYVDENDEIYVADFLGQRFSHWRYLSPGALARNPVTQKDVETLQMLYGGGGKK